MRLESKVQAGNCVGRAEHDDCRDLAEERDGGECEEGESRK